MYTPIAGVEVHIPAGASISLPLDPAWEYALVGVSGAPEVAADAEASTPLPDQSLLYLGIRRDRIDVRADRDSTLFLLGGEPFEADIVMWWNFVGRTHDEIVAARDAWRTRRAPPSASAMSWGMATSGSPRRPSPLSASLRADGPLSVSERRPRRRRT